VLFTKTHITRWGGQKYCSEEIKIHGANATIDHPRNTLLMFYHGQCGRQEVMGTRVFLQLVLPILYVAASHLPQAIVLKTGKRRRVLFVTGTGEEISS